MSRNNKILLSTIVALCCIIITACSTQNKEVDNQVMDTSMETPEETSNTIESEPISEESIEESEVEEESIVEESSIVVEESSVIIEESSVVAEEPIVEEPESQVVIEEESSIIEPEPEYEETTPDWFMTLCAVVEAETHECNAGAKARIVHVVRNRVNSSEFPNSYLGVCNSGEFVQNWNIQQSTIEAVDTALNMADTTNGALFFCTCGSGCYASTHKEYLFTDDVGHHFWR